jgi:hypothetical protein
MKMLKTVAALGFALALTTLGTAPASASTGGSAPIQAADATGIANHEHVASMQCGCRYRPYVRFYRVRYVYRPVYRVRVCGCRYRVVYR